MPFMDHFLEEVVTKRNNTVNRKIFFIRVFLLIHESSGSSMTSCLRNMNIPLRTGRWILPKCTTTKNGKASAA